jgi:hypothetical protein
VELAEDPGAVAFFQQILQQIKEEPGNPTQGISKFYVTCFSTLEDNAGQWSRYARSVGRFAIAFHPPQLNREPNSKLYRVIYDRSKILPAVTKVVRATLDFYRAGQFGERAEKPQEWAEQFYLAWDEWIYKLAPLVKQKHWDTEAEIRIVHELKDVDIPNIKLSQKATCLARYLELDLPCINDKQTSRLPIAKVLVGPGGNQAASKRSVMLLLERMGYTNVPVETSDCTLVET